MNEETKFMIFRVALATAFTCVAVKWMVDQLDPTRDKKLKAKKQAQAIMNKLKITTNLQVIQSFVLEDLAFQTWRRLVDVSRVEVACLPTCINSGLIAVY